MPTGPVARASRRVQTVVDRIRERLATPFEIDAVELRAAARIRVAIYPLDSRDAAGFLAASNAAMYTSRAAVTRVA